MTTDVVRFDFDVLIGTAIRRLREARGLSLATVAGHLGLADEEMARTESGQAGLEAGQLRQLALLFEVSTDAFFATGESPGPPYDSRVDTFEHILRVQELMGLCLVELLWRAHTHDQSKLESPEVEVFDSVVPHLKGAAYGTEAYRDGLLRLGPALEHHYARNRHHPEHFAQGVAGMTLLDLLEMVVDWKAASERGGDREAPLNLTASFERFGIEGQLRSVLCATVNHFGWVHV